MQMLNLLSNLKLEKDIFQWLYLLETLLLVHVVSCTCMLQVQDADEKKWEQVKNEAIALRKNGLLYGCLRKENEILLLMKYLG